MSACECGRYFSVRTFRNIVSLCHYERVISLRMRREAALHNTEIYNFPLRAAT